MEKGGSVHRLDMVRMGWCIWRLGSDGDYDYMVLDWIGFVKNWADDMVEKVVGRDWITHIRVVHLDFGLSEIVITQSIKTYNETSSLL
jgi:hypothetical protein